MFDYFANNMNAALRPLVALAVAFGVALWVVPVFRDAALKFGIVDRPSSPLKQQREPVPYLGGMGVYVSFLAALALTYDFDQTVLAILLPATGVVLLGLMDDFGVIRPSVKLLWQFFAVAILVKSGIYIRLSFLPEWAAIGLTFLWIAGCSNALNIIDIMDGLATSVAIVASVALFGFALWCGREMVAMMALALTGSLLGFLRYNRQPARIYLGDAGSLFIGFMLGALSINNHYTRINVVAAVAPVLVLGVPVFDTVFVSIIRVLRGRNPMHGSPDHFALRLRKLGLTVRQTVMASVFGQMVLCAAAVVLTLSSPQAALWVLVGVVAVVTVVGLLLSRVAMPYPPGLTGAGAGAEAGESAAQERGA